MKTVFENLVLELTRNCNMYCNHCLRGDTENLNMSEVIIDKLLENTHLIEEITFSGGEPTLNLSLLKYIIEKIIEKDIPVYSFFVATNGKENLKDLISLLFDFELYCMKHRPEESYASELTISQDCFHDPIQDELLKYASLFSFVGKSKEVEFKPNKRNILYEGRAKKYFDSSDCRVDTQTEFTNFELEETYCENLKINSTVYLNSKGYFFNNCDLSYKTQELNLNEDCHVDVFFVELFKKIKQ